MTQMDLGLNLSTRRTRKREFLDEMTRVVPWRKLIALIEPHYPKGKTGRPPFPIATMLRIHFLHVVQSLGPGDGGGAARHSAVPVVRAAGRWHGAVAR